MVWSIGLSTGTPVGLSPVVSTSRGTHEFTPVGVPLVGEWASRRGGWLAPRGAVLTGVVAHLLGGVPTPVGGSTWEALREKLRPALLMSVATTGAAHG